MSGFMTKVYQWMSLGLLTTAGTIALSSIWVQDNLDYLAENRWLFWSLMIAPLLVAIWLSASVMNISHKWSAIAFFGYSILMGIFMSFVVLQYTELSVLVTFLVCSASFVGLSIIGATTKRDLTTMGTFCLYLLIGLIVASIVNIFFASSLLYWITTYVGIIVFACLTAYDTQKIMKYKPLDKEMENRWAILGALNLYLDFINLFLLLLRVLGARK